MAERLTVGVAARLSRYLQVLTQAQKMGKDRISSQEISEYTNINATQIRRDLSGSASSASAASATRSTRCSTRSARSCARRASTTSRSSAPAGSARRSPARRSSPSTGSHRRHLRQRPETRSGGPSAACRSARSSSMDGGLPRPQHHRRRARRSADSAQDAANALIRAGVKIVFNYSEALLDVPSDVQVHTSNPAVELLYALYFHLTYGSGRAPSRRAEPASGQRRRAGGRMLRPRSLHVPGVLRCARSGSPPLPAPPQTRQGRRREAKMTACGSCSGTATCSAARARTSTPARWRGSGAAPGTRSSCSARSRIPSATTSAARVSSGPMPAACCPSSCSTATRVTRRSCSRTARGRSSTRGRGERRGAFGPSCPPTSSSQPRPARWAGRGGDRGAATR